MVETQRRGEVSKNVRVENKREIAAVSKKGEACSGEVGVKGRIG